MLSKPSGCAQCPLKDKGLGFVPDKISKHETIRLIGEAPGKNEVEQGEPFVGKAGFVLRSWLLASVPALQVAYERGNVSITNTLRCLPPEIQSRSYPRGQERLDAEACCRAYDAPLEGVQTVILFGESPQRAFFRTELDREDATDKSLGRDAKGVLGRVGRVYEREGRRYVFAPHPAFILRQPMLVSHAVEALKIATGAKYVKPEIKPWQEAVSVLK